MAKEVLIIGAGPAGLTAGYELLKSQAGSEQFHVTILEASAAFGGISRTLYHHGNRMDIGGHRFFSKNQRVMDFWQAMLPLQSAPAFDDARLGRKKAFSADGPDPEKVDQVMLVRDRVSRIYYGQRFFDYPISMKVFRQLGFGRTLVSGFSYLKSTLHKLPETSLENFYINRFGKKLYQMFFAGYTEKLWGRHPRAIAADWGSQRVKGLSAGGVAKNLIKKVFHIKAKNVETSLIEAFYYPKYGPGQLWSTVADEFVKLGGQILLQHQVVGVKTEQHQVTALVCQVAGQSTLKTLPADIVISSMPLKDLVAAMDAPVPDDIRAIAAGLPYRDFITVGLLVKRLQLKNKTKMKTLNNLVPDCWIYVQDTKVKLGRIQIFNNWSPYLVQDPQNTVWLGLEYFCNEGDDFWSRSTDDLITYATAELVKMNIITADSVLDAHCEKVPKAYPAYFDTYQQIDQLIAYLNTFDNLYCVGRNGQHRYNNMDHSMMTSFETVHNILTGATNKDNIWRVNTEKAYHESQDSTCKS